MTNVPVKWNDVDELKVCGRQSASPRYVIRKSFKVSVAGLGPGGQIGHGWRVVRMQVRGDGVEFVEVTKNRSGHGRIVEASRVYFVRQPK